MARCDRCYCTTSITAMSWFNTDTLCLGCITEERTFAEYEAAKRAEHDAVKRGDYHFPGVGLPPHRLTHK